MTDVFRKEYTLLTEEREVHMDAVKNKADEILALFNDIVPMDERSERSRCMAIARTNLETTIMWAVKAVTTKQE